jgi:uncharacterized protein DUF1194
MRATFGWPLPVRSSHGRRWEGAALRLSTIRLAAALLFAVATPETARPQTSVDLQLVLAVDVSGSVNPQRFELQKMGYVAAFQNRRVLDAILGGRNQSIAVTMMQWSGPFLQSQVVPWTVLKDESSVKGLAGAIESTPRMMYGGGTSISGAIDQAATLFPQAPYKAERRVIDVSGDGSNNRGRSVTQARDEAVDAGIVINGLPILAFEPYLDQYFKDYVIGGPGAFMIAAKSFETFAEAILMKLIIEIADRRPGQLRKHAGSTAGLGARDGR